MPYPITIICGNAGSGKDTVAGLLKAAVGGEVVAQADCIKRLAQHIFGFTDHQLWGPSAARNAPDERYAEKAAWDTLQKYTLQVSDPYYLETHFWDLVEQLPNETSSALEKAEDFGELLKDWVNKLHGEFSSGKELISPRRILQFLGTEIGREIDQNLWSRIAIETAKCLLQGRSSYTPSGGLLFDETKRCKHVFISDGRFHNEVLNVLAVGGTAVLVTSPSSTSSVGIAGHASESELASIPAHWFNVQLTNDHSRGLPALKRLLRIYEALFVGNSVSLSTRQISEAHS